MPKILIIEDEQTIRNEVLDWLQFEGFDVTGAENGRQGLSEARKDPPDLIVCDITMPELSGHDVLLGTRQIHISTARSLHLPHGIGGPGIGAARHEHGPTTTSRSPSRILSCSQRLNRSLGKQTQQAQQIQNRSRWNIAPEGARMQKAMLKRALVAMFFIDDAATRCRRSFLLGVAAQLRRSPTPERKRQYLDRIDGAVHLLADDRRNADRRRDGKRSPLIAPRCWWICKR
ncbi:MAG: response regulator [Caldilineaceae bacterium]